MLNTSFYLSCLNVLYCWNLILLLLLFDCHYYLILKLEHEALIWQKTLNLPTITKKTSLKYLLQNKLNIEYFTYDKLKDIFNIYNIYSFAYMNKLGNQLVRLLADESGKPTDFCGQPVHPRTRPKTSVWSIFSAWLFLPIIFPAKQTLPSV